MSDYDWQTFSDHLIYSLPWLGLHYIGSTFLQRQHRQMVPVFYLLLSSAFIFKVLGPSGLIFLSVQPVVMFLIHLSGSSILVYLVSLATIFAHEAHMMPFQQLIPSYLEDFRAYHLANAASLWINLRCLSFCLDRISGEVTRSKSWLQDLVELYSFCFYLPLVFTGPVITFEAFKKGVSWAQRGKIFN